MMCLALTHLSHSETRIFNGHGYGGIANAFGYSRFTVRVVALLGIFIMPVITLSAYVTALALLPTRTLKH